MPKQSLVGEKVGLFKRTRTWFRGLWNTYVLDNPWFAPAAALIGVASVTTVFWIQVRNHVLNPALSRWQITLSDEHALLFSGIALVLVYFMIASGIAAGMLREQRKSNREANRFYAHNGVLYNGNEPHIAFRVETVKTLIRKIKSNVPEVNMNLVMLEAGREAGENFGSKFKGTEGIYDRDLIGRRVQDAPWNQLDTRRRLDHWVNYDSSSGWGDMRLHHDSLKDAPLDALTIEVRHRRRLFTEVEGESFAHFLAGYCGGVLSEIWDPRVQLVPRTRGGGGVGALTGTLAPPPEPGQLALESGQLTLEFRLGVVVQDRA
jgi:hypothetical protein